MAVIRNTASALANGRIGNTTYYVANGQQIARQAQNNSNYGESASRTDAQQTRRVRWSNLVNGYKAMKAWMPKAFETKSRTQSDYNKFMQLNINSSTVALTKDMAVNGCCVWESWQVSQGSLSPISLQAETLGLGALSDIALSAAITETTTIAQLSQDILDNNPTFRNGDNIATIFFFNSLDSRNYPYATSVYQEFTLDTGNTALFSTLEVSRWITSSVTQSSFPGNYHLATVQQLPGNVVPGAFVWIHTRKVDGNLQVSSQSIYVQFETYVNQFSSDDAVQAAIDSYGVDVEVPLDPSFLKASFVRATANGAELIGGKGRIFDVTGSQTLVVTGRHMSDENVWLMAGEVRYTPLVREDGSWTYILGDNGTYKLYVNGNLYLGLSVSGIVVPEWLPTRWRGYQMPTDALTGEEASGINRLSVENANCINYPNTATESYPYFLFISSKAIPSDENIEVVNGTIAGTSFGVAYSRFSILPTDASKVCYVTCQGFIIAVFNYSE